MNIAIIPARGGSKRIIHKNIKDFCGRPIIDFAISAALKSELFDHVIVSTDSNKVAEIASKCGADVPFIRPSNLADDYTTTHSVIIHAVEECNKLGFKFENICCIYPSVPFIKIDDLNKSLAYMNKKNANYCFPVTEYPSNIFRALKLNNDGSMESMNPEFESTRTQDLDIAYHDAGQFYWGKKEAWLTIPDIHNGGLGYLIPNWRVVDIDTIDDWNKAEILHNGAKSQLEL